MIFTALIGDPVEHSVSPALFGALADMVGLDYSHLKIKIADAEDIRAKLDAMRCLNFSGANVTLPYKARVVPLCQQLSSAAMTIGAVNTLEFTKDEIVGHNTDWVGSVEAISHCFRSIDETDTVLILGAGGAGRAVAYGASRFANSVKVLNSTMPAATDIAKSFITKGGSSIQVGELNSGTLGPALVDSTIVINATSVGMKPNCDQSIIPTEVMQQAAEYSDFSSKLFFDVVYNPYETALLKDAKSLGANTAAGIWMMIFQAIMAFEIWTSRKLELTSDDLSSLHTMLKTELIK